MNKAHSLVCCGVFALTAVSSAQRSAQTDVTMPITISVTSGFQVQLTETYLDGSQVHVVTQTEISQAVPTQIDLISLESSLMASTDPAGMIHQSPEEQKLADDLNKSLKAINGDLTLINRQRVGLDVYNHLVTQHRKALRGSLALVKYMQAKGINDSTRVASMTKVVDQLEALGNYISSVNKILGAA